MKNLVLGFGLLICLSCSTQSVSVDYDRTQDFSQIKDYKIEMAQAEMNELDLKRIQTAIQQELNLKGMQPNPDSQIQIKIEHRESIQQNQNSQVGIGVGGGNHGFGTSIGIGIPIQTKRINQEFLISMYNPDNQMIWQGNLEIQMPMNAGPETRENSIKRGVQKLFKKYPPASSSN